MAFNIFIKLQSGDVEKIRLVLMTDGKATRNLSDLPIEFIEGIETELRVIDIEYIYKIYISDHNSLPRKWKYSCLVLKSLLEQGIYKSYLTVIKGDQIV